MRAFKWFLACVGTNVRVEMTLLGKPFWAVWTRKLTLFGLSPRRMFCGCIGLEVFLTSCFICQRNRLNLLRLFFHFDATYIHIWLR